MKLRRRVRWQPIRDTRDLRAGDTVRVTYTPPLDRVTIVITGPVAVVGPAHFRLRSRAPLTTWGHDHTGVRVEVLSVRGR